MERLTSLFLVLKEMEEEDIFLEKKYLPKSILRVRRCTEHSLDRTDFTIAKLKTSLIDTFGLGLPLVHLAISPVNLRRNFLEQIVLKCISQ